MFATVQQNTSLTVNVKSYKDVGEESIKSYHRDNVEAHTLISKLLIVCFSIFISFIFSFVKMTKEVRSIIS